MKSAVLEESEDFYFTWKYDEKPEVLSQKKGNNGTKGQDLRVWDEQTDLYDEGSDEDNGLSVRLNALRTRPAHWSNSVCVCVCVCDSSL